MELQLQPQATETQGEEGRSVTNSGMKAETWARAVTVVVRTGFDPALLPLDPLFSSPYLVNAPEGSGLSAPSWLFAVSHYLIILEPHR